MCLNTLYKWFTSCVLGPVNEHLDRYKLMEDQQGGAKAGCSGTTDNLLIDRMVTLAAIGVSAIWVLLGLMCERPMTRLIMGGWRRSCTFTNFQYGSAKSLASYVLVGTPGLLSLLARAVKLPIYFNRGLPQGDALCPRLFTLCLNLVACILSSTEGYRLSKPIASRITNLLYIRNWKECSRWIRLRWRTSACSGTTRSVMCCMWEGELPYKIRKDEVGDGSAVSRIHHQTT